MHVDDPGLLTAQPDLSNAARSESSPERDVIIKAEESP